MSTVPASSLYPGEYFRKRTGEFVYLVLRPEALSFHMLHGQKIEKSEGHVYGACYNGGVTAVLPTTQVVRCTVEDFLANIAKERTWELTVGVKHPSDRLD